MNEKYEHPIPGEVRVNASYSDIGDVFLFSGEEEYNPYGVILNENPLFFNPAFGNYHLTSDSPCKDIAQCGFYISDAYYRVAPYIDFEGEGRPGYGMVYGCDIGADEFQIIETCPGDFDWDEDVDGSDLAEYIFDSGGLGLDEFAVSFDKENCP